MSYLCLLDGGGGRGSRSVCELWVQASFECTFGVTQASKPLG